jgi:hypothetical protein
MVRTKGSTVGKGEMNLEEQGHNKLLSSTIKVFKLTRIWLSNPQFSFRIYACEQFVRIRDISRFQGRICS